MKAAYFRLALVSLLFLGWMGYLGYLVAERPAGGLIVLSRPQFLVSDLDVIAEVKAGSDKVTITEVLYPKTAEAQALKGTTIHVTNLKDCRPPNRSESPADLKGDGFYLLALQEPGPDGKDYRVTITPPSLGFPRGTPRIYPATSEVRAQYREIAKN